MRAFRSSRVLSGGRCELLAWGVVSDVPAPSPPGQPLPPPPPNGSTAPGDIAEPPLADEAERSPQAGELVVAWRVAVTATWLLAFLAELAVWKTSEEIGIATWWLGPGSDPQPAVVRLVPFAIPTALLLLVSCPLRKLPWMSLAGALVLALIAVPDFSRAVGLALIEMTIAAAAAVVSVAAFTGTYREPATADG